MERKGRTHICFDVLHLFEARDEVGSGFCDLCGLLVSLYRTAKIYILSPCKAILLWMFSNFLFIFAGEGVHRWDMWASKLPFIDVLMLIDIVKGNTDEVLVRITNLCPQLLKAKEGLYQLQLLLKIFCKNYQIFSN